jgi:hypothetical protein
MMRKVYFLFLIILLSSCKFVEEDIQSVSWVYDHCTSIAIGSDAQSCFIDVKNEDWKHYGNAVYYLTLNDVDKFNSEINKISDTNTIWYYAGKLDEALFKNNLIKAKYYLQSIKNCCDSNDVYLLESEAEILFREGYIEDLDKLLMKIPDKTILSSSGLSIHQSFLYFEKGEIEKVKELIDTLDTESSLCVHDQILMDYYISIYDGDIVALENLYEATKCSYVKVNYGVYLIMMGKIVESKKVLQYSLPEIKYSVGYIAPLSVFLMRYGLHDFAEYVFEMPFSNNASSFYQKNWNDSSDYYAFLSWKYFHYEALTYGEIKLTKDYLDKALSYAPRGYEANWLKYNVCGLTRETRCEEESLMVLFDHAPYDSSVIYAVSNFLNDHPEESSLLRDKVRKKVLLSDDFAPKESSLVSEESPLLRDKVSNLYKQ